MPLATAAKCLWSRIHVSACAALNACLPQAVGDLPELQDPVCKLCCSWWELQAPGREQLMAQTLPYILVRI